MATYVVAVQPPERLTGTLAAFAKIVVTNMIASLTATDGNAVAHANMLQLLR